MASLAITLDRLNVGQAHILNNNSQHYSALPNKFLAEPRVRCKFKKYRESFSYYTALLKEHFGGSVGTADLKKHYNSPQNHHYDILGSLPAS
mgnify:CR=1 FL=1